MDKAKDNITKECRIGGTCFTSLATIVGDLFKIYPKDINNVHRDSNNLLTAIIIFGTDVNGGKTLFMMEIKMNNIGKRAHVLKHSHGRFVAGAFDKIYMKALFGMVIELFYVLPFTNQYFFTLYILVQDLMTNV